MISVYLFLDCLFGGKSTTYRGAKYFYTFRSFQLLFRHFHFDDRGVEYNKFFPKR